ncbi:hypothetical protein [Geomonas sp.]|uniref:hypothetical protein n=1 Tax=Geomonas sp. TaxID=2651584 RepID=UPI002B46A714|nr:hypothetical protein [Geomonas sp.]HJV36437.1 hypothetical protein [Geomonas sp.]
MKKVLATIGAALAAISFAAIVSAADVPATNGNGAAPAATSTDQSAKPAAKPMKKHKKVSKHHHKKHAKSTKKSTMKKEAAPKASEAPMNNAAPAAPPAPPAK